MDEFAMGSSTENSSVGPTRNPWNTDRIPGGSSGGSAAAVAARFVPAALGSDTGGSVRQPAACCGVVGLKPTYGRISRYGLVAFASSLDQIGPLTETVADSARLYRVMAGRDPQDSTTSPREVGDPEGAVERGVRGLTVGFLAEAEAEGLDAEVGANVEEARRTCARAGARVVSVSVPRATLAIAIYYVVASAEASSNLARYDGVRYGPRASDEDLLSLYVETRTAGFGPEVKRRILLGTFALAAGYYDAYYGRAMRARQLLSDDFDRAFESADVIVCPSIPSPAFRLGEKVDDPLQMYLSDIFTVPASLAGLPAISVPSGFAREGLPLGIQVMAPRFAEDTMFSVARALEREIGFAAHIPRGSRPKP
jgi:aspartyl-tRNA(Asn)/glutamyl-tRNA(Gln) amidotransferase subunit A